ncbi:MAG TPA: hypothetical protein PLY87_08975 [Planctomycetaceae bacterium]|nr:hypothetical protein [Planctomycetaceae bacterium]
MFAANTLTPALPNPQRVEAGRRNQRLRRGLTEAGRKSVQESTRLHKPWLHATGPKSEDGKAISARNGRLTAKGYSEVRAAARALSTVHDLIREMRASHSEAQKVLAAQQS